MLFSPRLKTELHLLLHMVHDLLRGADASRLGQTLEPLLGRARFLAVYLLSAIGGSVGFLLLAPGQPVAVIGASGRSSDCSAACSWSSASAAATSANSSC